MAGRDGSQEAAVDPSRMRRNDPAQEAEIHARLLPGLRILLRHRLGANAAVDDLVQETMIVVLQHWRSGEIAESVQLIAFARATAVNLVANLRRAERRRDYLSMEIAHEEIQLAPSPESLIVDAEVAAAVRAAVAELPNMRDRQLLWRYYVQDQSKVDICRVLALDVRRFDKVLHRARSRLREHMLRNLQSGGTTAALGTLPGKIKAE